MKRISRLGRALMRDKRGATAIEYSLIVGLIFLAIVASVRQFTSSTTAMYDEIATTMEDVSS